jgi:hypothetical protein
MAYHETDNTVASVLRQSAQTLYLGYDKGIASMTTNHPKHARIGPAEGPAQVSRVDPRRAARGILVLALVLGGLGAEGALTSGHSPGDQASAQHAAGDNRPAASAYLTSSVRVKPDNFRW